MEYPDYKLVSAEDFARPSLEMELSPSELAELCELASHVAKSANEVVLDIYNSSADIKVELKADQTPVTRADLASDERIIAGLKKHTSFPIITEEHPLDFADRRDRKSVWLVDPLDGTQNFVNRDGQFSVLLSLIHYGSPVVGVISLPTSSEIYYGYYRGGAFLEDNKESVHKIVHKHPDRKLKAALSSLPSVGGKQREEKFCNANGIEPEQISRIGSSMKLAYLARGEYDLTVRFDVLSEWDTAAADCILSESNCQLKDVLSNKPIVYNAGKSLGLPGYMVVRSDYDFVQIVESNPEH